MRFYETKLFATLIVTTAVAGLAYLITWPELNPYINPAVPVYERWIAIAGSAMLAGVAFWLYEHWRDNFFKIRLYLAPLAGLVFGCATYYLTDPADKHWTLYTFMNLVQPSVPVQWAFTFVGFCAGFLTMLILGRHFFKPRFFLALLLANISFFGTGYGISIKVLPYLAAAKWADPALQKLTMEFLTDFGLSVSIFVGAFVFFFILFPLRRRRPPQATP